MGVAGGKKIQATMDNSVAPHKYRNVPCCLSEIIACRNNIAKKIPFEINERDLNI